MANCGVASQLDQLPPPPPHSAAVVSDAGGPTSASHVDPEALLPPPTEDPPASFMEKVVQVVLHLSPLAAIFSDTGEPTPASQVDPEAQLPPPPPPSTDDPPASLLEKVLPVVLQLMAVFTGGPTTRNQGHELAFKLYHLAVDTTYGFDIILVICLIAPFVGIDRPWVRKAAIKLISGVLALSAATAVLRIVIDLLP